MEIKERDKHLLTVINTNENSDNISADALSRAAFASRGKLYRDFERYTGHTVNEFLRKNRLAKALAFIKSSNFMLAFIAAECMYSSQQAMCRDVKNFTGLTPLQYKSSDINHFFAPEIVDCDYNISVSIRSLPETLCLKYASSSNKSIENNAIGSFLAIFPYYSGRLFGKNGQQQGSRFCYELYAENVCDSDKLKVYFMIGDLKPETTAFYATLTVKNDEEKINAAWDYIYGRWLSASMYEYSGEPYFEEYIIKNSRVTKLRLYLPLKKRSGYTNITIENSEEMLFCVSSCSGGSAEKKASEHIIEFMSENYPYLIKTSKEFYIQSDFKAYTCGIRIKNSLRLPEDSSAYEIKAESGMYAVLNGSFDCDYTHYESILLQWLKSSGFEHDKPFAVYDTENGYSNPNIRLYCKIKKFDTI